MLLSFFAYTSDDIEQLKKLSGLIKSKSLILYITEQVRDEFSRNRETKLAESIKHFSTKKIEGIPRFLVGTDEAKKFQEALNALDKAHNDLTQKAALDASSMAFAVDQLVSGLFADAGVAPVSAETLELARMRRDIGNPPGKGSSLGDQINWEYLLKAVPDDVTLHIVSKDGDYQSAFKNGKPHQFLVDEWATKKTGTLCLHQELKPFLNAQLENIKFEIDREKIAAIKSFVDSGSFSTTHWAITQLVPFQDALTLKDARELVRAGLENSQIRWVGSDSDVQSFYTNILDAFKGQLDAQVEEEANEAFRAKPIEEEDDDIPF